MHECGTPEGSAMSDEELDDIIAERRLELISSTGETYTINVIIGRPQRAVNEQMFSCPYQIKGAGSEKLKSTYGCDAIQCLQLVMGMVAADLNYISDQSGGRLTWDGADDIGFRCI